MALYKVDSDTADLTKVAGGTLYADLPIGSWIKNDMATIPSGFLKVGDTILESECPELYAKYGSTVPYKADTSELSEYEKFTIKTSNTEVNYDGILIVNFDRSSTSRSLNGTVSVNNVTIGYVSSSGTSGGLQQAITVEVKKGDNVKYAINSGTVNAKIAYYKKSLIVKAKHTPVPADFTDSLIGYLGQETNYNLYSWSHTRTQDGEDTNQDITIERDGWYSIDYTLSSSADTTHSFTFRDFDSQGDVHTIMRFAYDKSGTIRQTFLVPLKAGTYRYSHSGIGTLSVYINRRDFAY